MVSQTLLRLELVQTNDRDDAWTTMNFGGWLKALDMSGRLHHCQQYSIHVRTFRRTNLRMARGFDTTRSYIRLLRFVFNTFQGYLEPHMPLVRRYPFARLMLHSLTVLSLRDEEVVYTLHTATL